MRPFFLPIVLLLATPNSGCAILIGTAILPDEEISTETILETQTLTIDSEPQGARIIRDGTIVGTTPTELDFDYHEQQSKTRSAACWAILPLGAVDVSMGVAGVWGSYAGIYESGYHEIGVAGIVLAGIYALWTGVTAVVESGNNCNIEDAERVEIPRSYQLRLTMDKWNKSVTVRVPQSASQKSIVFRGQEESDWRRIETKNTPKSYNEYLNKYPSGRWRKKAAEQIAWQSAKSQNAVEAYMEYLNNYPKGLWRKLAEKAINKIIKSAPEHIDKATLKDLMASAQLKLQTASLVQWVRTQAIADVVEVLSDKEIESEKRMNLVKSLISLTQDSDDPLNARESARAKLCNFALSKPFLSDPIKELPANECKEYRGNTPNDRFIGPATITVYCEMKPHGKPKECVEIFRNDPERRFQKWLAERNACVAKFYKKEKQLRYRAWRAMECSAKWPPEWFEQIPQSSIE